MNKTDKKYHLIATRTVLPTLKSARQYTETPPQIVTSGTALECFNYGLNKLGGRAKSYNLLDYALAGSPVFQTADWTYWVVEEPPSPVRILAIMVEPGRDERGKPACWRAIAFDIDTEDGRALVLQIVEGDTAEDAAQMLTGMLDEHYRGEAVAVRLTDKQAAEQEGVVQIGTHKIIWPGEISAAEAAVAVAAVPSADAQYADALETFLERTQPPLAYTTPISDTYFKSEK